jgi:hypothetical protein
MGHQRDNNRSNQKTEKSCEEIFGKSRLCTFLSAGYSPSISRFRMRVSTFGAPLPGCPHGFQLLTISRYYSRLHSKIDFAHKIFGFEKENRKEEENFRNFTPI